LAEDRGEEIMADMVMQSGKEKILWIQYIKQRIKQNKNFLCVVTGPTGSGKSWTTLSIAEMLDDTFNADRIIFKGHDLMKQINSKDLPKKKGLVFVWDEAGIDLSSRSWQSLTNKMINFLIQTFRHRCFILFFTVPYGDFVDIATRKLLHAEFKTVAIDFKEKSVKIKPHHLRYFPRYKDIRPKRLAYVKEGGGVAPLDFWSVPSPSKELIEAYERKKTVFTTELNEVIQMELNKIEAKKNEKPLTEFQEGILDCWSKGITKQTDIAEILGCKQNKVSQNAKYMANKGYVPDLSKK